jgi:DNA invertase Pin-like site-specific DNA recombinase
VSSGRDGKLKRSSVCGAPHTAEFERAIIVERVNAGIARAKANGTRSGMAIGRPALKTKKLDAARAALAEGQTIRAAAPAAGISVGSAAAPRKATAH